MNKFSLGNTILDDTMVCLPICGDNPQDLVSELSPIQVASHGKTDNTTYISVDLAH